jgi:hypothetical protein
LPLDRNAKARILAYVRAYNVRMKQEGQHTGPITRAFMDFLRALLYAFHNSKDGRCFPSYERIAAAANCCRATVCAAIQALEAIGVLTWVHRLTKIRVRERDLFGKGVSRWRVIRTSNAYRFHDLPSGGQCLPGRESKNLTRSLNQENPSLVSPPAPTRVIILDPNDKLGSVLIRLGNAVGVSMETSKPHPE